MGRVSRLNKQEKTSWTLAFISLLPDNVVWLAASSPPMMHCALSLTQEAKISLSTCCFCQIFCYIIRKVINHLVT